MSRAAFSVLAFAALLALTGCLTHSAQQGPAKSPAEQNRAAPAEPSPAAPSPAEPSPAAPSPAAPSPVAPSPVASSPVPFRPVTPAPSPSQQKPASSASKPPPKASTPGGAPQPKAAAAVPAGAPASPVAPKSASLDLNSLEQRLKDTRAIGVFTKLSLKNQVDDLLADLREFHKGSSQLPQPVLRQKYDLLIVKVLSLLQNGDPPLAAAVASSREAIWQILMDPNQFAKI